MSELEKALTAILQPGFGEKPMTRDETSVWPLGCKDPDSCARHKSCMYTNCRHEGEAIKPVIDIVDRLRFDAVRCELQFSKGVAGNINEGADEIEHLHTWSDRMHKALHMILIATEDGPEYVERVIRIRDIALAALSLPRT